MSTSESRTGGYDRFIFSQFVPYVQYYQSISVKYMLHVCALSLQSFCFICSLTLVANLRCRSCQFLSVMIYESSSHVSVFYMFHMIHDVACIFTMDIIDIMISMIDISLYVIIMPLNYGIKMTWKLPIILTVPSGSLVTWLLTKCQYVFTVTSCSVPVFMLSPCCCHCWHTSSILELSAATSYALFLCSRCHQVVAI